jgi:hypothetical protein
MFFIGEFRKTRHKFFTFPYENFVYDCGIKLLEIGVRYAYFPMEITIFSNEKPRM